MRIGLMAAAALLALAGGEACAQSGGQAQFDGVKVGGTLDLRRHEGKYDIPGTTMRLDAQEGGTGFRVFAGVDRAIGEAGIIGVEAGLGTGGEALTHSGTEGRYSLKPGLSGDITARLGFVATDNILLYGRAGYNWLRVDETLSETGPGIAAIDRTRTRGGFMYGFGGEYAVTETVSVRAELDQTTLGHGLKAARVQFGGVIRY